LSPQATNKAVWCGGSDYQTYSRLGVPRTARRHDRRPQRSASSQPSPALHPRKQREILRRGRAAPDGALGWRSSMQRPCGECESPWAWDHRGRSPGFPASPWCHRWLRERQAESTRRGRRSKSIAKACRLGPPRHAIVHIAPREVLGHREDCSGSPQDTSLLHGGRAGVVARFLICVSDLQRHAFLFVQPRPVATPSSADACLSD